MTAPARHARSLSESSFSLLPAEISRNFAPGLRLPLDDRIAAFVTGQPALGLLDTVEQRGVTRGAFLLGAAAPRPDPVDGVDRIRIHRPILALLGQPCQRVDDGQEFADVVGAFF